MLKYVFAKENRLLLATKMINLTVDSTLLYYAYSITNCKLIFLWLIAGQCLKLHLTKDKFYL